MRLETAFASPTRIIEPTQIQIINPPALWFPLDSSIDTYMGQVFEAVVEEDRNKSAVDLSRARRKTNRLRADDSLALLNGVITIPRKTEITVWACGVTTEGTAIEVEVKTTCGSAVTRGDLASEMRLGIRRTSVWKTVERREL